MASEHLDTVYTELDLKPIPHSAVQFALSLAHDKIRPLIISTIQKPRQQKDLNQLIQKEAEKLNPTDIDENLRNAKLREAQRLKQHLQEKLQHIEGNIETLEATRKRPNLMDEKTRKEYMEEEKRKVEEHMEHARQLMKERKEREKMRKLKQREMNEKIQKDLEERRAQDEERQRRLEEEKRQRLMKLQEKSEQRRLELRERLEVTENAYQKVKKSKPYYILKQEEEEEKRKAEELERQEILARKKIHYAPIDQDEIIQHARRTDEQRKEHMLRLEKERNNKNLESQLNYVSNNFTRNNKALLYDKKQQEDKERTAQERLKLIEKRTRYAELVKEMFQPTIDRVKAKELELRKAQIRNPHRNRVRSSGKRPLEEYDHDSGVLSESETMKPKWRPRKFKPNPMIPRPEPKKEGKIVDYLTAQRAKRRQQSDSIPEEKFDWENELQNASLSPGEKMNLIKQKAERLEKAAKRKEVMINNLGANNLTGVAQSEAASDMWLSSIKAKLAVLEQISP